MNIFLQQIIAEIKKQNPNLTNKEIKQGLEEFKKDLESRNIN